MSSKGVLCALALIAAFPLVNGFNFPIKQTFINLWTRWSIGSVYELNITGMHGETISMSEFKGHPLLIVNLPLDCEVRRVMVINWLAERYHDKGLRIIGFPTADLANIYPTEKLFPGVSVSQFLTRNHIHFNVYKPIKVNGPDTDQLWKYLRATQRYVYPSEDYTMYIVNKHGHPVKRLPGKLWFSYEELEAILAQYL